MSDGNDPLESLLSRLEGAATAKGNDRAGGDAIDRTLSAVPRSTSVVSLRGSPEVTAYRQALTDGMIRADVVNRLLSLIDGVVGDLLGRA